MAPTPGILYVTMGPKSTLSASRFHDWYDNEHGPNRLRLPFVENGFRYRATDLDEMNNKNGLPEWMAIYDITDMAELTKETYLRLRTPEVQSRRERDTMKEIIVDRRLLDSNQTKSSSKFQKLEAVGAEKAGNVMVAVSISVRPGKEPELDKWYMEEHIPLLSKVPGWLRTRRFTTSTIDDRKQEREYLALHEYSPQNGLGGEEFKAATSTPWAKEIASTVVKEKRRRVYELYYTFGAAPRDLSPLSAPDIEPFTSVDGLTKTLSSPEPLKSAIESYITTPDGVSIPFRLEGSADPDAPLIVLSNSILVHWGIWDNFISSYFSQPENSKYRVLRYLTRGRSSACGDQPINLDLLSSDIIALLDALRVPQAALLIGVSLGGATVLNTALKYPDRIASFISCDTSAKSPEGNSKVWSERIAVSEAENAVSQASGEAIVGEQLAQMTVYRWFVKESYSDSSLVPTLNKVKDMVSSNSLEGFRKSVKALWEYDVGLLMKDSKVKGAFLVGKGDGVLPGAMKIMAEGYGQNGGMFFEIDGAGHLPMVEKPEDVAQAVTKFLGA